MEQNNNLTVGVGIISWKDKKHLKNCIPPLLKSPLNPRVVLFNSDFKDDNTIKPDNDGTVELAKKLGAEIFSIPRTEMNHGIARERTRKFIGTDIVVIMTPDAYAKDEHMIEKLIKPIVEGKASVAYARQIPRPDANAFVSFGRAFNYPPESHIRRLEDAKKYGSYTSFASNACCAWLTSALDEIGGFRWVLSGEDAVAASMLIKKGHKIAYVANAIVEHSHSYGPKKEFIRHFDTGMYRKRWVKVLDMGAGSDEQRGKEYAKQLFIHLWKTDKKLILKALLQLIMGFLGYQFGRLCYKRAPLWLYKKISPADFFWLSKDFKNDRWNDPAE